MQGRRQPVRLKYNDLLRLRKKCEVSLDDEFSGKVEQNVPEVDMLINLIKSLALWIV